MPIVLTVGLSVLDSQVFGTQEDTVIPRICRFCKISSINSLRRLGSLRARIIRKVSGIQVQRFFMLRAHASHVPKQRSGM